MKKTIFLSAAMALATIGTYAHTTTTVIAQGQRMQGTPDERAKRQADRINADAKLSPEQYNKVLAIAKDFAVQREAARNSGAQGEALKSKMKAITEQEDAQLKTVLTPDQFAKVLAARQEQHGRGK